MYKPMVWILAALMMAPGLVYGQENFSGSRTENPLANQKPSTPVPTGQKFTPIQILRKGTEKRPTAGYFHDGVELNNFDQLKAVIDPLNDPEASRLLKTSAGRDSLGAGVLVVGGLLAISAGIYGITAEGKTTTSGGGGFPYSFPTTTTTPPDETPLYVLGISGVGLALIGLALEEDGANCRIKAVKRYNQVVEPDQNLSMFLTPGQHLPGLEWTGRF